MIPSGLKRLSVLLVEDDPLHADLLIANLNRSGIELTYKCVDDAAHFRDLLFYKPWDVIISDYNLPAFSVTEILSTLNANRLDIPCLVVSGCIGEAAAVQLMKAGACDFIPKDNLSRLVPAILREVSEARNRRDKRKIEQTLRQKDKLFAEITAALGEGLLVINPDGEIILINPEAERLLGWDKGEILGKNLQERILYLKPDCSPYQQGQFPIVNFAFQGVSLRSENEVFVRKNGNIINVSYVATPIFEDDQQVNTVIAFQDISSRVKIQAELIESRRQLRALSNYQHSAREEERIRIARELHDELGQALGALKIDLSWLMSRLTEAQDQLTAKADKMLGLIDSTMDSVQRIAANLRPCQLDDLGIIAAMEWLLEEFQQRSDIASTFTTSHEEIELEPETSTALFRILQETTTNVLRHATATQVTVNLTDQGDRVSLVVKDNGKGFQPEHVNSGVSFGLLGIRERVISLNGQFDIRSQPGAGTEILISLPKTPSTTALQP